MSQVLITQSKLDELALQVSGKSGEDMPLTVDEMTEAVAGIVPVNNESAVTVTPSVAQQVVTPDSDHTGLSQVTVEAVSPVRTNNDLRVAGAIVYAPYGWYATEAGKRVASMTLPTTTSTTGLGVNMATVGRSTSTRYINIPTGYNESPARYTISAVANGTAGTPTASKSVSGSTATVTPSVTNTTGYITGSTKTGTAVTVTASELVSGTKTITGSGTTDVTEYASASVAAGGATASASKSVSGHTATVTPSVTRTAGWVTAGSANGTAVTVSASELVSGTKSITSNGTGIDVTEYAAVDVAVPGGAPSLQAKTGVTPSTSSQTITADAGYDGLSSVQIDAMPSGVVVPASAISTSGGATISTETGKIVLTKTVNNVPQVTTAGYVTSGTFGDTSVTLRATANIQGAQTITPGTSDQTIAASTWLTGTQTISGDANLVAGNIKSGTSIFGVAGTYSGGGSAQTATGTFTGNGTRQVTFSCAFEPDLVYWYGDPGTTASSGTVAGIIARDMAAANRYRNNSTTNSHYMSVPCTGMNTNGSSYSHRATYDSVNKQVTLYCFSSNARSLFTNGRTYSFKCVKWT